MEPLEVIATVTAILSVVVPALWFVVRRTLPWLIQRLHSGGSRLSRIQRTAIRDYIAEQLKDMLCEQAAGSGSLSVKDIVASDDLYISPPWQDKNGTSSSRPIVEHLIAVATNGQSCLLLGEPGQGKTIVLKRVYRRLVQNYLELRSDLIPLYVPLRSLGIGAHGDITLSQLHTKLSTAPKRLPLEFATFRALIERHRIVLLLDGIDEIYGEVNQQAINLIASSEIFSCCAISTCRTKFFEFYLTESLLVGRLSIRIRLQLLDSQESLTTYTNAMCRRKGHPAPDQILADIRSTPWLRELVIRPLLLAMTLEILTDPTAHRKGEHGLIWLYRNYTTHWLKHEAGVTGILWDELRRLVEEVAWNTYNPSSLVGNGHQRITFSKHELNNLLKPLVAADHGHSLPQLIEAVCFHSVLVGGTEDDFYFVHKSFQEYFVARRIVRALGENLPATIESLRRLIPLEVSKFVKEALDDRSRKLNEKLAMTHNLIAAYQAYRDDSKASTIIREQASYYLACIDMLAGRKFLRSAYRNERNKYVQRGMMVGLALFGHQIDVLNEYLVLLHTDTEALSINAGYHLVYYGDQPIEEGYHDDGTRLCRATLRSLFRHLDDEVYLHGWALDLITLNYFLQSRGLEILMPDQRTALRNFFRIHPNAGGPEAEAERDALVAALEEH